MQRMEEELFINHFTGLSSQPKNTHLLNFVTDRVHIQQENSIIWFG